MAALKYRLARARRAPAFMILVVALSLAPCLSFAQEEAGPATLADDLLYQAQRWLNHSALTGRAAPFTAPDPVLETIDAAIKALMTPLGRVDAGAARQAVEALRWEFLWEVEGGRISAEDAEWADGSGLSREARALRRAVVTLRAVNARLKERRRLERYAADLRLPCPYLLASPSLALATFPAAEARQTVQRFGSIFDCPHTAMGMHQASRRFDRMMADYHQNPLATYCAWSTSNPSNQTGYGSVFIQVATNRPESALEVAAEIPFMTPREAWPGPPDGTRTSRYFRVLSDLHSQAREGLEETLRSQYGLTDLEADRLGVAIMTQMMRETCPLPNFARDGESIFSAPPTLIPPAELERIITSGSLAEPKIALWRLLQREELQPHPIEANAPLINGQPLSLATYLFHHYPALFRDIRAVLQALNSQRRDLWQALSRMGLDPNLQDDRGWPLLAMIAQNPRRPTDLRFDMLIEAGADITLEVDGETALDRYLAYLRRFPTAIPLEEAARVIALLGGASSDIPREITESPQAEPAAALLPPDQQPPYAGMALIVESPETALRFFAEMQEPFGRLGEAFVMQLTQPPSPERDAAIRERIRVIGETDYRVGAYDGSLRSFMDILVYVSERMEDFGFDMHHLSVPCGVVLKYPDLQYLFGDFHGGSRDNFTPRTDCNLSSERWPATMQQYLGLISVPTLNYPNEREGTIRYVHYKMEDAYRLKMHYFPLLLNPRHFSTSAYPFESWSLLGLSNRRVFERIREAYDAALPEMAAFYRDTLNLTPEEAETAAAKAMWALVYHGHWLSEPDRDGLHYWILSGQDRAFIEARLRAAGHVDRVRQTEPQYSGYEWAWQNGRHPEPVGLVAAARPDILALLVRYGLEVDATNDFAKTALMAAAQEGNLHSVEILLDAGAEPNAVTGDPERVTPAPWGGMFDLQWDYRTALMYAGQAGADAAIERLLEAGADPSLPDTQGLRAIHYYFGQGPIPRESDPDPETTERLRSGH